MPPLPQRRTAKAQARSGGMLLAVLPKIDLTGPQTAPSAVIAENNPIEVYTLLARQIRRCWLSLEKPKLANHDFRAEASAEGGGKAKIAIYRKVPGRKLGPFAFHIDLLAEGTGTLVKSTNRRLPKKLANTLRADIARWVKGSESCKVQGGGK